MPYFFWEGQSRPHLAVSRNLAELESWLVNGMIYGWKKWHWKISWFSMALPWLLHLKDDSPWSMGRFPWHTITMLKQKSQKKCTQIDGSFFWPIHLHIEQLCTVAISAALQ